jgi:hypothetical protein
VPPRGPTPPPARVQAFAAEVWATKRAATMESEAMVGLRKVITISSVHDTGLASQTSCASDFAGLLRETAQNVTKVYRLE